MDIASLLKKLQENIAAGAQNQDDNIAIAKDRIKSYDPNFVGPSSAGQMLPAEKQMLENNMAAITGSIQPVQKAGLAAAEGLLPKMLNSVDRGLGRIASDTSKEAVRRSALNSIVEASAPMNAIKNSQQALSREVDFANRARQQKFDKIKKMFGN